jgi:aminopeptidase N
VWGRPRGGEAWGYTVIEMPEGYGSEATPGYLLQAAAAFRDPEAVAEVYHEVGHSWNARASPRVQGDRWFDEAFASYFAALALGTFNGPAARDSQMARARSKFLVAVAKDSLNATVPIAQYGAHGLGDDSYTKGAWSLYVLNRAMGDNAFRAALRDLFAEYGDRPADYHSFEVIADRAAGRSLSEWFRAWIYGAESSRWLEQGLTVDEMASRAGGGR